MRNPVSNSRTASMKLTYIVENSVWLAKKDNLMLLEQMLNKQIKVFLCQFEYSTCDVIGMTHFDLALIWKLAKNTYTVTRYSRVDIKNWKILMILPFQWEIDALSPNVANDKHFNHF